ncbi:CRISPR-associated helicase/endonuclease Cas3 [Methanobacterium formicicum]|uniref:CRISPR-associated helicase Cas3 n=1 Tax=Methanobacterium formicicum (strain DSM 3637 / PP1) TaxID=1204725 RepID=K2R932_METFP|nr:CRISPR-associated helicase/endonuclease Cas3 [Methanobacterium formicicum]EKF84799.1 CRISPR-associated helicase Cas3 [Methanobacterium formicicum DSM 3637]
MVLLAKPDETLMEHTENSLKVFKSIKAAYEGVPELCGVKDFWEHLFYSLFFHDFGKGATGFQTMLAEGSRKAPWRYRHEILSAGFVSALKYDENYKKAIGLSIITHHKDITKLRERYNTFPSPNGKKLYSKKLSELEPHFEEISSYFDKIGEWSEEYLGYKLENFNVISFTDLEDVYKEIALPYFISWEDDEYTTLHGKYGIFMKGFLNACDHLASGSKYSILNGIQDMRSIYNFPELRKMQEESLNTKGSAFLTSPTGSGKTEASLFWSDANQNTISSRRVFYLLPYTASINAMYNRLQRDFKEENKVGLLHGKASYFIYKGLADDLEKYEETERNSTADYDQIKTKIREIKGLSKKIYRPYKVLTPFQILKAFFGSKGFEMQLSEMTNGLFILDEIHAYDAHLTSLILEILKILKNNYSAEIFIMSATLPTFIKKLFKENLSISTEITMKKDELDKFTRHKVDVVNGSIIDNLDIISDDLYEGKRVLVVCNTVLRAQEVFEYLSGDVENSALLHSRFMLKDREKIEKSLDNLNLLVGTQAIEVSLDIDYDVLYSEPAPIDALIQRFGRVNRKGWKKDIIAPVNIFSEGSEKDKYIYTPEIVQKTVECLEKVDVLNEALIQKLVDEIYSEGYVGKDKEEFDLVQKHFAAFNRRIVPFINDNESEMEFYSLFQSYEVVPFKYKLEYLGEIESGRYFEAMSYFLSISVGQFKKLESENRVDFDKKTYFVDAEYDEKIGLMLDKEEDSFL